MIKSKLIATGDAGEVVNEKVSPGLQRLLTTKTLSKKVSKPLDIARFKELLELFEYKPTPAVKRSAKYRHLFEEEVDVTSVDVNRNLAAMRAGNTSAFLVKQTMDEMMLAHRAGSIDNDTYNDYLYNMKLLLAGNM